MSQTLSPARRYGLVRVARVWKVARAGVYRSLKPNTISRRTSFSELRATEFSFRYAEGSAIPATCLQRPFLVSRLSDADIREQARRCAATLDHRACSDEDTPCKWRPGGGWDSLQNLTRC